MTLEEIKTRMTEIRDDLDAMMERPAAEWTDEEKERFDALEQEARGLQETKKRVDSLSAIDETLSESFGDPQIMTRSDDRGAPEDRVEEPDQPVIPARARTITRVKGFTGPDAESQAYTLGLCICAAAGSSFASRALDRQGIRLQRALGETVNTAGGFLVPDVLAPDLIKLVDKYGVFRQHVRVRPMSSDILRIPRRTGGNTAYFVGESTAGTESDETWDQVTLIAKKAMVLTKVSSELNEDAIISIGDEVAEEFARAIAYLEDYCGFRANGEGTYAGIVGVGPRITNVNGVDEGGGVIVGTGDTLAELVLGDFSKTVAILPEYADNDRAAWYCHRQTWANMQRLEAAAGGNTITDLIEGGRVKQFLGYPVHTTSVMLTGSAVSQVLAILGDLSLAADMGIRREVTMAMSQSALNSFEQDELAIKSTVRFDVNVHDVGTATVAGPVVALVGKAS